MKIPRLRAELLWVETVKQSEGDFYVSSILFGLLAKDW